MDTIRGDLRFAGRQMRKHLGFTVVAVLTLGLGLGATTTFFSILNTFSFKSLPFRDAGSLVVVTGASRGGETGVSFVDYEALADAGGSFDGAAAYARAAYNLGGGTNPQRVAGAAVTAGFFSLLGTPPAIGRGFAEEGGERVVVLSRALWEREFLSDPRVVGRTVTLDGAPHTVVGVAPPRLSFPEGAALWVPLEADPSAARDARGLGMLARLRAGVREERADAALATVARGLAEASPATNEGWTARATPLREVLGAKLRGAAVVLLVASLLVLVIACGNLASLQLVLVSARTHEMAVRAALGASRARLVRLLVTEGVLLALVGAVAGVLLARGALGAIVALLGTPPGAEWMEFTLDYRVLLFALVISVLAGLAASLGAAVRGSRAGLRASLQEGGRGGGSSVGGKRLRRGAVLAQIAIALPLVVGASTVVLSAWRLDSIDPGFDVERLVALRVSLAGEGYDDPGSRAAFVEEVVPRFGGIAGSQGAAAVSHAPLFDRNGLPSAAFVPEGWDTMAGGPPVATLRFVTDGYQRMMGIPLLRGRFLTASEARDPAGTTVVVNDALARRFFPGADPVGRRLHLRGGDGPLVEYTVAGVVADVVQRGLHPNGESQLYLPYPLARELSLMVRTGGDPAEAIRSARSIVASVDPTLPLHDARTTADMWSWFFRDRVGQGAILGALGVTALLLALLGVYGVTAFSVAQRRREFGVRIALGGRPADLLRLVFRDGAAMVAGGTAIGLLLALGVTRFLSVIFSELPAFEPLVFFGVASLLALSVLLASYLPARDATKTDPTVALRAD